LLHCPSALATSSVCQSFAIWLLKLQATKSKRTTKLNLHIKGFEFLHSILLTKPYSSGSSRSDNYLNIGTIANGRISATDEMMRLLF